MTPEAIVSDLVDLINRSTAGILDKIPPALTHDKGAHEIVRTLDATTFYYNDQIHVIEAWANDRMIHVLHPKQAASLLAGIIDILSDAETLELVAQALKDNQENMLGVDDDTE